MNASVATMPLGKVAERNERADPQDYPDMPYIGLDDVEAHTMRLIGWKSAGNLKSSAKKFYKRDVLYSRLRPYLNKIWVADRDGLCSSEFIVLPEQQDIDPKFLAYRINARDFVAFANSLNSGDRPRVNFRQISPFGIPDFDVDEQRLIVEKIETLFSELDKGVESLKTARQQLKAYRQAVLKHAFEGKITEQWRQQNPEKLESPEQLLARIQQEREQRYQQKLEEWKQAVKAWKDNGEDGKKPGKPANPSKIKETSNNDLPRLPNSWIWVEYAGVCEQIRNGISAKPSGKNGIKILRISAVRAMEFDVNDVRYLQDKEDQYKDYFLSRGDLVFTRYNGTRDYVGVCAEYRGDGTHLFPDKLIQTRIAVPSISTSYMEKAINSSGSRKFMEKRIRTTAGQSGISGGDVKRMPVPICCKDEQVIIGQHLESELSKIAALSQEIEEGLIKAEALRQSILKKAFSGQLVNQISNEAGPAPSVKLTE